LISLDSADRFFYNRFGMRPKIADLVTALVFTVFFSSLFVVLKHPAFYSGDHGIVFIQAESLIKNHFTSLEVLHKGEIFLAGPYQDNDNFLIRRGQNLKAVFPPALAAVAALLRSLFGRRGLFLAPLLSIIALALILRRFFPKNRLKTWWGFIAVVTTPVLFYGYTLSAHAPASLFAALSCYFVFCRDEPRMKPLNALGAGVFLGIAVWFRTELYCLFPALLAGIIFANSKNNRWLSKALILCAAALIPLIPLWVFNYFAYGHPLGLHIVSNTSLLDNSWPARRYIASQLLAGWTNPLVWAAAIASIILAALSLSDFKTRWSRVGGAILAAPAFLFFASALAQVFYQPKTYNPAGLFYTAPITALLPLAFIRLYKAETSSSMMAILISSLIYVALVLLVTPTDGGLQWGPRLLLPGVILMSAANISALTRPWAKGSPDVIRKILLVSAVLAGAATQYNGLQEMHKREKFLAATKSLVSLEIPDDAVIVTDLWWAEQVFPEIFLRSRMFYVSNRQSADRLLEKLSERNVDNFYVLAAPETGGGPVEKSITAPDLKNRLSIISVSKYDYHNLMIEHFRLIK